MPIQLLPPQLANQIAAGEVVERPSSVVKELVENSLDAGATQIDIDIEKGGSKLIRVRDNGCGISEQELVLALSRHATSKVSSLADLEAISSLGFRGEALASISSVSRLTLTSKTATQAAAWQASAAGRDMAVQVKPAAHPEGTSIEVLDLFFNTPARRRFLRTDKTEFSHIDELVKRLALSRFDVAWTLTHNGQTLRRLPAALSESAKLKRLNALCGRNFAEQALWIESHYGPIQLNGWLLAPAACQENASCQYSYVNGRMMRDKLLNHAIRQAYGERLGAELQPAFVLFLTLDASEVDVNVHPAKHEVRFHQARLVHDFVVSALSDALLQSGTQPLCGEQEIVPPTSSDSTKGFNDTAAETHYQSIPAASYHSAQTHYSHAATPINKALPDKRTQENHIQYLASTLQVAKADVPAAGLPYLLLNNAFALCQDESGLWLVDLATRLAFCWQKHVQTAALLLPVRFAVTPTELAALLVQADTLALLGFDLLLKDHTLVVRAVPIWLRHTMINQWFSPFLSQLDQLDSSEIATKLMQLLLTESYLQVQNLLHCYPEALVEPQQFAKKLQFDQASLQIRVDLDDH